MATDSFFTAKGQKAFQDEMKYATDHHHYPGEHKHAEPPPLPKTVAQPAAKKSYSVSDAAPRGADNKSLALRVNHPEHRDDLSKMFHQYAINHSANPYTPAEKQHNANIYGYVKKAYGKDTADDMHRHAEAMRSNDVYGIRAKYHIQEAHGYAQAKAQAEANRTATKAAGDKLDAFDKEHGRFPNGLVPDSVRAHPERMKLKQDVDRSFQAERNYNGVYAKQYKKEIRADHAKKYSKLSEKLFEAEDAVSASDSALWAEHQRRYSANSSHSHIIAKAIEDEISKRHGGNAVKDMIAHSVLHSLGHNEPTRALIRRKNGITLTEASMAKRELVPNQELAMDRATYKNLKKQDGLTVARQMNANRKALLSQLSTNVKR